MMARVQSCSNEYVIKGKLRSFRFLQVLCKHCNVANNSMQSNLRRQIEIYRLRSTAGLSSQTPLCQKTVVKRGEKPTRWPGQSQLIALFMRAVHFALLADVRSYWWDVTIPMRRQPLNLLKSEPIAHTLWRWWRRRRSERKSWHQQQEPEEEEGRSCWGRRENLTRRCTQQLSSTRRRWWRKSRLSIGGGILEIVEAINQ